MKEKLLRIRKFMVTLGPWLLGRDREEGLWVTEDDIEREVMMQVLLAIFMAIIVLVSVYNYNWSSTLFMVAVSVVVAPVYAYQLWQIWLCQFYGYDLAQSDRRMRLPYFVATVTLLMAFGFFSYDAVRQKMWPGWLSIGLVIAYLALTALIYWRSRRRYKTDVANWISSGMPTFREFVKSHKQQ